jgi:hypothetical protein
MRALTAEELRQAIFDVGPSAPVTIAYRKTADQDEPYMMCVIGAEGLGDEWGTAQLLLQAVPDDGIGKPRHSGR